MTVPTLPLAQPDYAAIKSRQRQTWASGNYHVIASLIVPVSERLCDTIELRAGERVLDVATGSGNTALAAARRLCDVTAMDYVPSLLERGRARASAEGLRVIFEVGDAESLPVDDASFDVTLSTFGTMFAPNQEQAASELLRVTRPGGRIGLANWTPTGWIGEMLRIVSSYVAPPAGLRPPTRWGTEDGLRELFGDGISSLSVRTVPFNWRFGSEQQFLSLFRGFYGPVLKAFASLDEAGREGLARDLTAAVQRFDRSSDATLVVPSDYLEVVAVRA